MPRGNATLPEMEAGEESPASSYSPEDVRALISDMAREMADLREQVASNAAMLPKFQPNQVRTDYAGIFSDMERGKPFAKTGNQRQIIGTDGNRLSDAELRRNPPMFGPGDVVRLNLDGMPRGGEKTWRELVDAARSKRTKVTPSTVGRVRYVTYRRDDGTYKYRCVFPGLTALSADKDTGDGFDESDLLPYEG